MLLSQHVIHEKIINKTLTFHGLYEILETELAFDTTHTLEFGPPAFKGLRSCTRPSPWLSW